MSNGAHVFNLDGTDVPGVVDLLSDSFSDYPAMRFVLGSDEDEAYRNRLQVLLRFFTLARILRGEFLLGVGRHSKIEGAALVSRPDGSESPTPLARLREETWAELGARAHARYAAFAAACAPFQPDVPHLHLNMIGVGRSGQGHGFGRRLMEHIHGLSRDDRDSRGVTLNTEDPANLPLYEHFGYECVGHARIAPDLESWGFFKPDG